MILLNGAEITVNKFFDGTFHVKFLKELILRNSEIEWIYQSEEEFVIIQMLKKMLDDHGIRSMLFMPYFPNARMDRIEDEDGDENGEMTLFTLKYFIELLNDLDFTKVITRDPHSSYIAENVKNIHIQDEQSYVNKILNLHENVCLMFPDKGAYERYAHHYDLPAVYGEKTRNWRTGELEEYNLIGEIPENCETVLIIDDICSRGGTFSFAATKLREAGFTKDILLYVTHVEDNILNGNLLDGNLIKHVYSTKSIDHAKLKSCNTLTLFNL